MCLNKIKTKIIFLLSLVIIAACTYTNSAQALLPNWTSLPPFNTPWPLSSPALSPVDPFTGLRTPVVSEVTSDTILPVQPVHYYNPLEGSVNFLFNGLPPAVGVGNLYNFSPLTGITPFPPAGVGTGFNLPVGFEYWAPVDDIVVNTYPDVLGNIFAYYGGAATGPEAFTLATQGFILDPYVLTGLLRPF